MQPKSWKHCIYILLLFPLFGCGDDSTVEETVTETTSNVAEATTDQNTFEFAPAFPEVVDTNAFIGELFNLFDLEVATFTREGDHLGKITTYKKVSINGSERELMLIVCEFPEGPMVLFPWKHQLLLEEDGRPIGKFAATRHEFVEIFPGEKPFLMIVTTTAKGKGGHSFYRCCDGQLLPMLDNGINGNLSTYDCHEDFMVYDPCELPLRVEDRNDDGWNDLAFSGELKYLQGELPKSYWQNTDHEKGARIVLSSDNPAFSKAIEFIFLYNKEINRFVGAENYKEKYDLEY